MTNSVNTVIALTAVLIAWQTYKINEYNSHVQKDKLRLELFDKRHKVFSAFRDLFISFFSPGTVTSQMLSKFIGGTADAEFLFGDDIAKYRQEIIDKSLKLIQATRKLSTQSSTDEVRNNLADEVYNLEEWFGDQLEKCTKLFHDYLHFSTKTHM